MTDGHKLDALLADWPFVVIDEEKARLATRAEATRAIMGGSAMVANLDRGLQILRRHAGADDREFSLPEIAAISQLAYANVDLWIREGLFRCSIREGSGHGKGRVFSLADAFVAATLASLRRHGIGKKMLKQVAALIYGGPAERQPEATEESVAVAAE
jgi:hypothetical protein